MQDIKEIEKYLSSNISKISSDLKVRKALRFKSDLIKHTKESTVWHIKIMDDYNLVKEVFAKHTSSDEIFWEYQFLNKLNKLTTYNYKLSVPKPLFYLDTLKVLVTEKVKGVSFKQQLTKYNKIYSSRSKKEYLKEITISCAKWLKRFHRIDQKKDGKFINSKYFEKFDYNLNALQTFNLPTNVMREIYDTRSALHKLRNTERVHTSYLHGDFAPPNILVNEGSICVLDLSYKRRDLIYYDISYFMLSILLVSPIYKPIYDGQSANEYAKVFLDTYFEEDGGPSVNDIFYIDVYYLRHLLSRIVRQYRKYYQTNNLVKRGIDVLYLREYYSTLIENNIRNIKTSLL